MALIAGPTASGKSAFAMDLALRERGTIINADASQIYRDLRILTARPTPADEARVPHLLYGHVDAAIAGSAATWAEEAKAAIERVVNDNRLPILVGGTGLYFKTLLDGIAPIPPIMPEVRAEVRGLDTVTAYAALQQEDPSAAARLHSHDTTRIHRALETIRSTGMPIATWRAAREGGIGDLYRFEAHRFEIAAADLALRCDARVDAMFAAGAIDEVRILLARNLDPSLPAMRAIGVAAIRDLLDLVTDEKSAVSSVQSATRHYAKRQRTWFRHQFSL